VKINLKCYKNNNKSYENEEKVKYLKTLKKSINLRNDTRELKFGESLQSFSSKSFLFFTAVLKRPGRDADHSPPSSAEVVNE
jgi:hypothetical protein